MIFGLVDMALVNVPARQQATVFRDITRADDFMDNMIERDVSKPSAAYFRRSII